LAILKYVKTLENHPEEYLDEWNLLEDINLKEFKPKLRNVRENIEKTLKIPFENGGFR
jgi:hypothetical protein